MSSSGTPGNDPTSDAPGPATANRQSAASGDSCLVIFLVWGTLLMPFYMVYRGWALKRTPGAGGNREGSAALLTVWTTLTLGLFGAIWGAFYDHIAEPPSMRRFWHAAGATWCTLATLGLYPLAWRKLPPDRRGSISIYGMWTIWVVIGGVYIVVF